MENVVEEISCEHWNWPEGIYPPVPPIDLDQDVCYLSTGTTDEEWKFGSD